jgi:xanthine dehydrogenase molybdenum-binding subunit
MDKVTLFHVFNREVDVRSIGHNVGGSFGTKFMCWQVQSYAIILSRATLRPSKSCSPKKSTWRTSRSHRLAHPREGRDEKGRNHHRNPGNLVCRHRLLFVHHAMPGAVGAGELMIMIQCPNWDLKNVIVATNRNASGSTRGFGGQELECAFNPTLNLTMEKAGLDPFEVYKKNFVKPGGGYYWRDGVFYDNRGVDFTKAMDEGAKAFGWKEKWKGWLNPTAVNGAKRIGVGVGVHGNADIGEDTAEAYVQLAYTGTATIFLCVAEFGTGQKSNYIKMAARFSRFHRNALKWFRQTRSLLLTNSAPSVPEEPTRSAAPLSTLRKTPKRSFWRWRRRNWARIPRILIRPTALSL